MLKKWFIKPLQVLSRAAGISELREQVVEAKFLSARLLIRQLKAQGLLPQISDAEFKVFSQFGDDGIIQYLIQQVNIPESSRRFIEFGVQDYQECNTRFLLMNDNWSGLILDGSASNIEKIIVDAHFWRHDLTAVPAFICTDNVNDLFARNGFEGEIGLLSIDIDGNDYWIWEAIEIVNPIIVVCEYNSFFGAENSVTIPYDPLFKRNFAHYSNLYWGASLKALCSLAVRRGYAFVGCNSAGNNAYFVRRDKIESLQPLECSKGYVKAKYREGRNRQGKLINLPASMGMREIAQMPILDLETQSIVPICTILKI